MPPRTADVTAQSQRNRRAGGAGEAEALTGRREAPTNPARPSTACAYAGQCLWWRCAGAATTLRVARDPNGDSSRRPLHAIARWCA